MAWASILALVIKIVAGIADYLRTRQLLDAGKAEAIASGLQATLDNMSKADAVKKEVTDHPTGDFASSVQAKYERRD